MQQDSHDDRKHLPPLPNRDDLFTTVGLCHAEWLGWHYATEPEEQTTR